MKEKNRMDRNTVAFWSFRILRGFFQIIGMMGLFLLPGPLLTSEATPPVKPDFQQALQGYEFTFPEDHGSHDEFLTEWWYFTGHLFTDEGRRFGYELTFFRRAIDDERVWSNSSDWAIRHLYFAHFALTDEREYQFQFTEKVSRAGLGKAGAERNKLETWVDRWKVQAVSPDHRILELRASSSQFSIHLRLKSKKPPVIHGVQGVSRKGSAAGQSSHYYSLTRLETEGELRLQGEKLLVNGMSWMDHEFGSADLGEGLVGWDWFSIQLETGYEIMAYWLRREDGSFAPTSSGTIINPDGSTQHLTRDDVKLDIVDHWTSEASGTIYPNRWTLEIPRMDIVLDVTPRMHEQELVTTKSTQITYWEGAVDVSGTSSDSQVQGMGYVELTGYAKPFKQTF